MPSRPEARVFLTPASPSAGDVLRIRVELESGAGTTCDGVDVAFVGRESRYRRTVTTNNTARRTYHRREVVRLGAHFDVDGLAPGVWVREVEVPLPADLPPSYRSGLSTIEYEVALRVSIPWWPDLEQAYPIAVRPAPSPSSARSPRVFTTQAGEHRGDDPVLELSLESDRLAPGGSLGGTIAITGLGGRRLRRVEIECSAVETALVASSAGPHGTEQGRWEVHEGTPGDGEPIAFRLGLPPTMAPTFESPFIRVEHALEARAVVAFGRDVTLRVPVSVAYEAAPSRGAPRDPAPPLVGRDRYAAVWREAIERGVLRGVGQLTYDADRGRATFAARGVRVAVTEEPREGLGPCLVAALGWEPLGLGLRVADRRWTDLGGRVEGVDAELQRRFTVKAREAAQVRGLLSAATRELLALFDEAAMDDDGAVVLRKGGVYQVSGLERFLALAHDLARHLAGCIEALPPPHGMEGARAAYERFAGERGARLRVGDLSIHDWAVQGVPLSLTQRFGEGGAVVASVVAGARPERADERAVREAVEGVARTSDGEAVVVDGHTAGVSVAVVMDPARVAGLALRVSEALARAASGVAPRVYR